VEQPLSVWTWSASKPMKLCISYVNTLHIRVSNLLASNGWTKDVISRFACNSYRRSLRASRTLCATWSFPMDTECRTSEHNAAGKFQQDKSHTGRHGLMKICQVNTVLQAEKNRHAWRQVGTRCDDDQLVRRLFTTGQCTLRDAITGYWWCHQPVAIASCPVERTLTDFRY
jgi:hypothetical protein